MSTNEWRNKLLFCLLKNYVNEKNSLDNSCQNPMCPICFNDQCHFPWGQLLRYSLTYYCACSIWRKPISFYNTCIAWHAFHISNSFKELEDNTKGLSQKSIVNTWKREEIKVKVMVFVKNCIATKESFVASEVWFFIKDQVYICLQVFFVTLTFLRNGDMCLRAASR